MSITPSGGSGSARSRRLKVLAVNLSRAFFMSQAVLPHMVERGSGRIINISSIIGETGNIGRPTTRRRSPACSG
jgi:NAD(P)-dependent dehydrogenase (short-subunit alcohol dehydrogenase family)